MNGRRDIKSVLANVEWQLEGYQTIGVTEAVDGAPGLEHVCHVNRVDLEALCDALHPALKVLGEFAEIEPVASLDTIDCDNRPGRFFYCLYCEGESFDTLNDLIHDADCPWVMARRMLGIEEE